MVRSFGVRYRVPTRYATGSTILAVNVGGAIVPVLISIYLLMHMPAIVVPALIGVAIVTRSFIVSRCRCRGWESRRRC